MTRILRYAKFVALPAFVVAGFVAVQAVIAVPTATIGTPLVTDDAPAGACATVSFSGSGTDPDAPATVFDTFAWDLAGEAANGATVSRTFAGPGPHAITLTASSSGTPGATDEDTLSYTVPNTPPSGVGINAPGTVDPNEAFTATSSGTDNGRIDTQEWDLDDDGTFEVAGATAPGVSFATSGAHEIHFRAVDNCGAATTATATVNVEDAGPLGTLDVSPEAVLRNQLVTLTATASDPGGTITGYEWDLNGNNVFGEAGDQQTTTNSIQTSFATSGNHRVRVRVTDNGANQATFTNFVRVNFPPEADFALDPSPPLIGDAVRFRTTRASDPDGTIASYEWDLDGNGTYEQTGATPPARTFASAGARTASLRVTDDSGEQAVVSKAFTVGSNIRPEASFRFNPGQPKVGEEVTFTSTSDDADDRIVKHEWDFNFDGRYDATGRVVTRAFKSRGRKPVALRVTDSRGAVETSAQTVVVQPKQLKAPVDVKRSLGYIREDWGVRLVVLYVKVPAKTTVKVSCKGKGCPRGTFVKRTKDKRAKLRFDQLKGSVRAGAKVTVISTRLGHVPAYDIYTIRDGNRSPVLREGCRPPGTKRVRALSSCSG
jgi:hypothetical protein